MNHNRYYILLRASGVALIVLCAKALIHFYGWELLSINALFSGIVAANVFLMGFLLSGVLTDYKESEKLPGELAACLENLAQDLRGIGIVKPEANVAPCLNHLSQFCQELLKWFYKKHGTTGLLEHVDDLTAHFADIENNKVQINLVARLKQEQSNLRRALIRIHTIRETSFVSMGYMLAYITTILLCIGLILARIEPFYESFFLVSVISYLMIFLLMLIRDLDNPFGYYERCSGADVSLKPLEDASHRLAKIANSGASELKEHAENR